MPRFITFTLALVLLASMPAPARAETCDENEVWDVGMAMCMPKPEAGKSTRNLSIRANVFGVYASESGPRGLRSFTAPDMVMADFGTSVGASHYFNVDLMATAEKWTFPSRGNPELFQIGEENSEGVRFVDAQHPHSSPIMGLTFSDTIAIGPTSTLRLSFAPRGESGDGPIAFMHRPTGEVNPDAPLGHHLGQDSGHISSTVFAASLGVAATHVEASFFHGSEPHPTKVDLPLGAPDSYAVRLVHDFSPAFSAMISEAYVTNPEHDDPAVPYVTRYSASIYTKHRLGLWSVDHVLILGMITKFDRVSALRSVGDELLFRDSGPNSIFTRFELVERTPEELAIPSDAPDTARNVVAVTLGYTRAIAKCESGELGFGASVTHDFLPAEYRGPYGGDPWTGKIFLRLSGAKNWDL